MNLLKQGFLVKMIDTIWQGLCTLQWSSVGW
jgi:hypothetical protein